jgi:sterol desaturase/sphingolipid hydroxylase (fatty acid hydroxylase superfamily)
MTALARYLSYPLLTGGATCFAWWAITWGWPLWAIAIVVVGTASVLVEILERLIPYSKNWSQSHNDLPTDIGHYLLSNRFVDLGSLMGVALFLPIGKHFSAFLGVDFWPHHWPLGLRAILALIAFEFPWYWIHRLEHELPLFWRFHAVHHSAKRIYWWNLSRNHPLDNLVSAFCAMGLLAILGVDEAALSLVAAFSGAHGMLQHANVDLRTGFLDYIFTTARVHRFHHASDLKTSQANYGPTLTLWDYVFGSRHFSAKAIPSEDIGLGPTLQDFPEDFWGQWASPFEQDLWERP